LLPKQQCSIEVNFGRCGGRLALDWVYLKKSSIGGNKYTKDYESNNAALGYF
jgi:hypothetical protein